MFQENPYCVMSSRPAEVKALLEVAKLNDVTIDNELFDRIFDRVYEKSNATTVIDETTTRTRTETNPCISI